MAGFQAVSLGPEFFHSFHMHVLSTYYVPGTVLAAVDKDMVPACQQLAYH